MALITFDWETYYDKDYQLKKMTTEEYIRSHKFEPIGFGYRIECEPPEWVTGTDAYIERRLRELRLEEHRVVMHNAPFDAGILSYRYNIHPKFIYDTLSMARPLIVDVKNGGSLDKLSQRFGLGEKGKEVIKAFGKRKPDFTPAELAEYGEYCKNDVVLTYLLFHVLQHFSTPQECYMIDMLIRMYTDPVLVLDRDVLKQHLAEVQAKKAALMAQIDSTIGRKALMSNPQFAQLLQDLGIDPPMKISPKTGKVAYAFSKKDVEFNNLLEHPDERVQTLVAARLGVKSTQEETRTESFMRITYRGAMPVPLRYYAAHTGRAGGWDKINLQNLPRGGNLRRSMAAPEGHMLVACDSSQIEARITAWLAGQTDLVEAFANGDDIYSKFASVVYGRPVDRKRVEIVDGKETKPDFAPGFVGKTAILGLGFGMGKDNFQRTLKIGQGGFTLEMDISDCERTVNIYRTQYPMIPKLWKSAEEAIKAMAKGNEYELGVGIKLKCDHRGVHLPNGMIQRYDGLRWMKADGDKYRQDGYYYNSKYGPKYLYGPKLVENIVQALARIVVFNQMAIIDQKMKKFDRKMHPDARFKVVLTVHDEVVCVCPTAAVPKVEAMMLEVMSKPPRWAPDLPIACEASHGRNYAEAK